MKGPSTENAFFYTHMIPPVTNLTNEEKMCLNAGRCSVGPDGSIVGNSACRTNMAKNIEKSKTYFARFDQQYALGGSTVSTSTDSKVMTAGSRGI
jgi:hypothetical protein